MPHDDLKRIVLTPGEPAGIGPELTVLLAQRSLPCRLAVIADPDLLRERATTLQRPLTIVEWRNQVHRPSELAVLPEPMTTSARPGRLDPANARYVLSSLDRAIDLCLGDRFDALVTGPVHKGTINDAGIAFSGHTEYLAQRTGSECPVMLLAAGSFRVALLTTHVPLTEVGKYVTRERIERITRVLAADLERKLSIAHPRIAVCGLNPHAGEGGHLGREELDVIQPAVTRLRASGLRVAGPFPADTVFIPDQLRAFDVVLAMYHDQGLPVLKHAGFGKAVNITLGLPIIRTSVDHGTAVDLAGTGRVEVDSLASAVAVAIKMAQRRSQPASKSVTRLAQ